MGARTTKVRLPTVAIVAIAFDHLSPKAIFPSLSWAALAISRVPGLVTDNENADIKADHE